MKTLATTLLIASTLAIGTFASPAADKDTQRPQRGDKQNKGDKQGKGGGGRDALFAVLDADGDGALSAQELQNAVAALGKLDKNGDGNLTQEELKAARGGKGGKGDKARRGGNREGKGNKGDKQR